MENVCIIGGTGKFGQFFKQLFENYDLKVQISIIGRNNYSELPECVKKAGLIIISVPSEAILQTYDDISKLVDEKKAVIDLSSSMALSRQGAKKLNCGVAFVHPLFAPNAKSLGLKYIACVIKENSMVGEFLDIIRRQGSRVKLAKVEDHQKIMAYIQALSHFNSILLAKTITNSGISIEELEEYSTIFFRLEFDVISRIFAQNTEIYADIQFENEYFKDALNKYKNGFDEMRNIVEKKDIDGYRKIFEEVTGKLGKALKDSFEESQSIVKALPANRAKVGFLGPSGSFSEKAAWSAISEANYLAFDRISDTLKAVNDGLIDYAVVPIENSVEGSVTESIDNLYNLRLFIKEAIVLPIRHCCAAISLDVKPDIVLSHPQALAQCSEFISKSFPGAKLVQTLSTAQAFNRIAQESLLNAVAIGPEIAAEKYGLKIIKKNIQNKENNQTKFALITKNLDLTQEGNITSLVIVPKIDKPGLLFNILKHFKEHGLNLTKIESRPAKIQLGTYVFHIDVEGNYSDKEVKNAVEEIKKEDDVVFLGSYNQRVIE